MANEFDVALDQIKPSQLFISSRKLARILDAVSDEGHISLQPVPIKRLGADVIFTDGHTRAFATFLGGARTIRACWETDALDWQAYAICVDWCRNAGIYSIGDLVGRVVAPIAYETLWLDRCAQMHEHLEEDRRRRQA